jgi:aspartyl-tRNA(Asn)/glutamyl-tRNA(Gln) amidotransferase subunit C
MKTMKTKIDIQHVAKLAQIKLTPDEHKKFAKQLPQIIDYFSQLKKVNTKSTEPLAAGFGQENKQRQDKTSPRMSQKETLKNAPKTHNDFFKVPPVL